MRLNAMARQTFATRQCFSMHHGVWTEAFDRLAGSQTVIGRKRAERRSRLHRHIDSDCDAWKTFQVDRQSMFLF